MVDKFLSDEDKALFDEHMRAVKPLNDKTKRVNYSAPKPAATVSKKKQPVIEPKHEYYLSDSIQEEVLSQSTLSYSQAGLNPQRFKALKKGLIRWESRLDLHGFKSEKARDALCYFIQSELQQGRRCVLIIHGKGGQAGAPPIIKNLVNRWLAQFEVVLAFHSALPQDGGTGAVYVLLKKPTKSAQELLR